MDNVQQSQQTQNMNNEQNNQQEEQNNNTNNNQDFQQSTDYQKNKHIYELNWYNLLEKEVQIEEIMNLINQMEYEHKKYPEKDNIIEYVTFKHLGIQLSFENEKLSAVFFYNKFDKKIKQYKGPIPYNLNMEKRCRDIGFQFGEATRKNGGKSLQICKTYEHLGLEITFLTKTWEDYTSFVDFYCLYKRSQDDNHKMCGYCKKPTQQICQKCKLVYYCSRNCQSNHWRGHKQFCLEQKLIK